MSEPANSKPLWKRASTYVLLGIPSAIVFMASVKVEDARSNIAGWLNFFGVDRVPAFLASSWTDLLAVAVGLISAILSILAMVYASERSKRTIRERYPQMEEWLKHDTQGEGKISRVIKGYAKRDPNTGRFLDQ